jgi:hypothetical protein
MYYPVDCTTVRHYYVSHYILYCQPLAGANVNQPKDSGGTVQTAVRLPKAAFERLKESELGISGDLRRRLDWTFDLEPVGKQTLALLTQIARMAYEVRLETGAPWWGHPGAHAAFSQAILSNLARLKPEGSTEFGERQYQSIPGDDPQEIGVWVEHDVWSMRNASPEQRLAYRAEKERSYREIVKLHEQRQREGGDK